MLDPTLESLIRTLDESIRTDFITLRASYFGWLKASTVLVTVGLVMEGPEIAGDVTQEIHRLKRWHHPTLRFHPYSGLPSIEKEPIFNWRLLLAAIGWVLIIAGVAGEFAFESLASNADALIQTFNTDLLTATQRETIEANRSAREANDRANSASIEAKKANDRAAIATREAGENKLEAARLNVQAADEAGKRVAIEQELQWRSLSPEQEQKLSVPIPPEFLLTRVQIDNIAGDAEGGEYAAAIFSCLWKAGWPISGPNADLMTGRLPQGVFILSKNAENNATRTLAAIFQDAGISAEWQRDPKMDEGITRILVAIKPRPKKPQGPR